MHPASELCYITIQSNFLSLSLCISLYFSLCEGSSVLNQLIMSVISAWLEWGKQGIEGIFLMHNIQEQDGSFSQLIMNSFWSNYIILNKIVYLSINSLETWHYIRFSHCFVLKAMIHLKIKHSFFVYSPLYCSKIEIIQTSSLTNIWNPHKHLTFISKMNV